MAFDYSTIFSGAELGDVWLADGSHFQDTGRTTPAGNGDPVGSLSGDQANFNAEQATGGLQPTLRQSGSIWYLEHVGDYLTAGAVSDWKFLHDFNENAYVCVGIRFGTVTDPGVDYGYLGTAGDGLSDIGVDFRFDDTPAGQNILRWFFLNGSGSDALTEFGATEGNTDVIVEFIRQGSTLTTYVNGVEVATTTQSGNSTANSSYPLYIGAIGNADYTLTGRIYSLLVTDTIPSAGDRLGIQRDTDERLESPTYAFSETSQPPAGTLTLGGALPFIGYSYPPAGQFTITGVIPGESSQPPAGTLTLGGALPAFINSNTPPAGTLTLGGALPAYSVIPISAVPRRYRARIVSASGSLDQLVVPVNWQARYAYSLSNYLAITLHNADSDLLEAITAAIGESPEADTVTMTLQAGYQFASGAYYENLISSTLQVVQTSQGSSSSSTVLSGYFTNTSFIPKAVTIGSASVLRSGTTARGWTGPIDYRVKPGDYITVPDSGEAWVVGNIVYRVDGRSGEMDISELTNATDLAGLPW